MTTRIDPVRPPYPAHVAERLDAMMPPGVPPILLFRTFVRNLPMTDAMSVAAPMMASYLCDRSQAGASGYDGRNGGDG